MTDDVRTLRGQILFADVKREVYAGTQRMKVGQLKPVES